MSKRKGNCSESSEEPASKKKAGQCILHIAGHEKDHFTSLSCIKGNADEKLAFLHSIRVKRLSQPLQSRLRMEAVCHLIPESLESLYLETCGYHRQCY